MKKFFLACPLSMYVCIHVRAAGAGFCSVFKSSCHKSVSCEYEYFNSKNRDPLDWPQSTKELFLTALTSAIGARGSIVG
jgi:hypothetical protein